MAIRKAKYGADKTLSNRVDAMDGAGEIELTMLEAGTEAYILVYDSDGVAQAVAISGDVTIAADGTITIGAQKIDMDNIVRQTEAQILIGKGTEADVDFVAVSGDITIAADGAVTISAGSVGPTELSGVGKNGTGAGYTIALVTAAFGDPSGIDDGFVGIYRDSSNSKTYHISVYGDTYYGVEEAAVPSE